MPTNQTPDATDATDAIDATGTPDAPDAPDLSAIPQELQDAFASILDIADDAANASDQTTAGEGPVTSEPVDAQAQGDEGPAPSPADQLPETRDTSRDDSAVPFPAADATAPEQATQDSPPDTGAGAVAESPATDATTDAPSTPDATPTPTPASASGYTWTEGTNSAHFTDAQVQEALYLQDWVTSLPGETRAAVAALAEGNAIAIPRADFEAFTRWQQQESTNARDADLADFPEEYARVIREQRDRLDALTAAQSPGQSPTPGANATPAQSLTPTATANANTVANLEATAATFEATATTYARDRNLTQEELDTLVTTALQANLIGPIAESMATVNPLTGQILRPADPAEIMTRALDMALVQNPALVQ